MKGISEKTKRVPPSGIRKFFEMTLGMPEVISLGVGEPDFITPWHIREAGIYSLEEGYTMYTSNYGLIELRELISEQVRRDYGVGYSPEDEILITTGVSEAFDLGIRAIVDPGDEVILPEPCYVSYKPCIILAGGIPVTVKTKVSEGFRLTPEEVEEKVSKKTKVVVLSYPSNPTGATMSRKDLEAIADVAVEHDLLVLSDEIYAKLTYAGRHTCFSSLNGMRERTILFNGFSKSHAMTGWRVGYAAGNSEVIEGMMKIHQYTMLCAPITAQMAAIEGLRRGEREVLEMVRQYNQRRHVIVKSLNEIGLECFEPKGAFYAFPSIKGTGLSSEEFAGRLLKEKNVAVVPGNAFGESGEGFVRCCYAVSIRDIKEALLRIEEFIEVL